MNRLINIFMLLAIAVILATVSGCDQKKKSKKASLQIDSIPEGAKIFIANEEVGTTPFKTKANPGTYIFKLQKLNYNPTWIKITCSKQSKKSVEVPLIPITASALLRSSPSKAKVIIDGKVVGETPLALHDQTVGKYTAILEKHGYVRRKISWTVTGIRPQSVFEKLSSNLGTLAINTNPTRANIFIDGKARGYTPFRGEIENGKHTVRITKNGYALYEQALTIPRNKKISKTINLQILPGSIEVKSTPPGSAVFVNDRQYENTPATITNLKPGVYDVRIERRGFDPVLRKVTVHAGRKMTVTTQMDSNTGRIHLATTPPGITIYLDGKLIGKTVKGEHKKISKVFVINNVSMGSHTVTAAHKRAIPNRRDYKLRVKKGETKRLKNIKMWIADAVLYLKDGKRMEGRLASENPLYIMFEIEPGVTQHYERKEIKKLVPLQYEE